MQGSGGDGPKRQRQVAEELDLLDKDIESLSAVVANIEGQLSSVLTEPMPPEDKNIKVALPAKVPLAENIQEARHRVRSQSNRLNNMLDRLEL